MPQDNRIPEGVVPAPVKPPIPGSTTPEVVPTTRVERPVPGSVLSEVEPVGSLPLPTPYEDPEFMAPFLKYEDSLMAVGITKDLEMRHLIPISGETFQTEQGEPFKLSKNIEMGWFGKSNLAPYDLSPEEYSDVGKVDILKQTIEKSGIPIPWKPRTIFISGRHLGDTEKRYKTRAHEVRHHAFDELRKRFWPGFKERIEGLDEDSFLEDALKIQDIAYPFDTENEQPPFPFPHTVKGTNKSLGEEGLIYMFDWLTNDARLREMAEYHLNETHYMEPKHIMINLAPGFPARKQIDALEELSNQLLREQGRPQRPPMDINKIIYTRMQELSPEDRREVMMMLGMEGPIDVEEYP